MQNEMHPPSSSPVALPGARLKAAREAAGLSVEELSALSNLTKQVIRSLEQDHYQDLAGLGLVRGYLKLYARKVGLDEQVVLEPFDRWRADVEQQMGGAASADKLPAEPSYQLSEARLPRWIPWLGGVLMVSVAGYFFWTQPAQVGSPVDAGVEQSEQASAIPQDSTEPQRLEPVPAPIVASPVLTLNTDAGNQAVDQGEALADQNTGPVLPESVSPMPAGEDSALSAAPEMPVTERAPDAQVSTADQAPMVEPQDARPQPSAPDDSRVQAPSTADALQISVTGDSWVEVRDQRGRVVFADLMRSGRALEMETVGEIGLVIGAMDRTRVTFNGQAVDLSPHAQQNVARLSLGVPLN